MSDQALAAKLQEEFLTAAGGCETKAAKLVFEVFCTLMDRYPDSEKLTCYLRDFAGQHPSLAPVLFENLASFGVSYVK